MTNEIIVRGFLLGEAQKSLIETKEKKTSLSNKIEISPRNAIVNSGIKKRTSYTASGDKFGILCRNIERVCASDFAVYTVTKTVNVGRVPRVTEHFPHVIGKPLSTRRNKTRLLFLCEFDKFYGSPNTISSRSTSRVKELVVRFFR